MSDTVEASHILVTYVGAQSSSASRSKEEALERIQMVAAELVNGLDFTDLAGEYSECPSGKDGGSLGTFGRGDLVPEFDDAVFDLEVGMTSEVIETAFGYHLIQRTA